jgi:hypothetical protein
MDHEKYFNNLCDEIDATVFSGDYLDDPDALNEFRKMLERWERKSKIIQESIDEKIN